MVESFPGYERARRGRWRLLVDRERWREEWWPALAVELEHMHDPIAQSRHARTRRLALPDRGGTACVFLKRYESAGWTARAKQVLRGSRAGNALRMSLRLARDGFHVPRVLAAGEEIAPPGRAFLLTEEVVGAALRQVAVELRALAHAERRRRRRAIARALGEEVARLHACGYVHGDLLATNILLQRGAAPVFCFLDHDRTSRPALVRRAHLQRRNLVQLNRLELEGVSHADRLRFFHSYATGRLWSAARVRSEARWLAERTRRRREWLARRAAAPALSPGK